MDDLGYGPATVGGVGGQISGRLKFLGTCFAFRRPDRFLTAAHVVEESTTRLYIAVAGETETAVMDVDNYEVHPHADLAVLKVETPRRYVVRDGRTNENNEPPRAFRETACLIDGVDPRLIPPGIQYEAFGYDVEMPDWSDAPGGAVGRLFRGYAHRRMTYSIGRRSYAAIELSEPVPPGASGAPLYEPGNWRNVFGLATGTAQSSMPASRVTESLRGEMQAVAFETATWRVGLGLLLEPYRAWLDDVLA